MSVSNFTSATFSVVEKYTQITCIFVSKIRQRKSTLKFACKKSACKSLCKNLHASFLRGFFVEIRHIACNLRACKCCNARGLYCMVICMFSKILALQLLCKFRAYIKYMYVCMYVYSMLD